MPAPASIISSPWTRRVAALVVLGFWAHSAYLVRGPITAAVREMHVDAAVEQFRCIFVYQTTADRRACLQREGYRQPAGARR